jgi:hypothetical protein
MSGYPEKDEENWFRPVWETDDEAALEPLSPPRARKPATEPDYNHRLMTPLAKAHDAVARLEAKVEMASEAVAEGLRARMVYLEAAGWLGHAHIRIHPRDLALRDYGLTTSYGAAAHGAQLGTVLPSTVSQEFGLDLAPSVVVRLDIEANLALCLARQWRRLGEFASWRPLADAETIRKTMISLGSGRAEDGEIEDWLTWIGMLEQGPVLIRAARAAREWTNRFDLNERNAEGVFLAACLWRQERGRRPIALPFWSALESRHDRLNMQFGIGWIAEFLECVTAAAVVGLQELERLRQVEEKGRLLRVTARSRLPDALNAVLRTPIVTATSLAKALHVTPVAARGLLDQLVTAGLVREAMGRASWRAYVLNGQV